MTSAFYSKAQGVVIVFDVTDRETFNALPSWIHDVKENAPPNCLIQICVNKTDCVHRAVSKEEYTAFAQDHNIGIIEASAQSGLNVDEVFTSLGRSVLGTNRESLAEVNVDPHDDKASIILREFAAKKSPKRGSKSNPCCSVC
mmetsp:Transcript_29586/g.65596  ORF Transcript_29586/g.65596 Transcript_29586/m.65596 type:complete len:143 (+) Transcript_29586:440-868(+)